MPATRILVADNPRQAFTVRLGDRTWRMRITWHPLAQGWYLDIFDVAGEHVISGVRLTNRRRLLQGYRIDFPGDLFVHGQGEPGRKAWAGSHRIIWLET